MMPLRERSGSTTGHSPYGQHVTSEEWAARDAYETYAGGWARRVAETYSPAGRCADGRTQPPPNNAVRPAVLRD